MAIEKRIMAILGRDWRLKWKVLQCAWRDLQLICTALQSNCMFDGLAGFEGEIGLKGKKRGSGTGLGEEDKVGDGDSNPSDKLKSSRLKEC
jgi:hypothetical protein